LKVDGGLTLEERLKVGGKVSVGGDIEAGEVRVGGKIEAYTLRARKYIETNVLRTRRGAKAVRIEIAKRGEVEGPLVGEVIIINDRARVEDVYGDDVQLRSGCRARSVYGRKVRIENGCDVDEIIYTESLRSDPSVRLRSAPQKTEKLPDPPL